MKTTKPKKQSANSSKHTTTTHAPDNPKASTVKKYFTKSIFKVGHECPAKLRYLNNKDYADNKTNDPFLKALADGGFQVAALAKCYHPNGIEVRAKDHASSLEETKRLLATSDSVTIFEAAFTWSRYFLRADIIETGKDAISLIEVKAKSIDTTIENIFYDKRKIKSGDKVINTDWEKYLVDVAFQSFVLKKIYPNTKIDSYLMLADKNSLATVNGLNQKFFLDIDERGRTIINVSEGTNIQTLGNPILIKIPVNDEVDLIHNRKYLDDKLSFEEYVGYLADIYFGDADIAAPISKDCKKCEFHGDEEQLEQGLKCGFRECWTEAAKLKKKDFNRPFVFDIWNFKRSNDFIENKKYFAEDVNDDDLVSTTKKKKSKSNNAKDDEDGGGLSTGKRQRLQVQKIKDDDTTPYLDVEGLAKQIDGYKFPLHFIDFETSMVAVPFYNAMHPYEQVAFQYSGHTLNSDGSIRHTDEYINTRRGEFPNFDFVRNLKKVLEKDDGTIFKFAAHENTVLCQIYQQLKDYSKKFKGKKIDDADELIAWIRSVTHSTEELDKKGDSWIGVKNMEDMCDLVKRYHYDPATRGSNSIKQVLPAVLNASEYLQAKYSKPIYGAANVGGNKSAIISKNYKDQCWIKKGSDGKILDPYHLLAPIFPPNSKLSKDSITATHKLETIAEGGAAMTAYLYMQFVETSDFERAAIVSALLKYCELDTMAMVLIFEYWQDEIKKAGMDKKVGRIVKKAA